MHGIGMWVNVLLRGDDVLVLPVIRATYVSFQLVNSDVGIELRDYRIATRVALQSNNGQLAEAVIKAIKKHSYANLELNHQGKPIVINLHPTSISECQHTLTLGCVPQRTRLKLGKQSHWTETSTNVAGNCVTAFVAY